MPGPEYVVRIVHRRVHEAVGVDHGRGLQVVGRDALPLHPEHGLGDVGEAAPVERERDVEPRDAACEELVRGLDVRGAVAVGHLARVVARRRGRDLLVGDRRQPELREDGLHRTRGALAHPQHLVLGDRLDARVDLPVALDREPLVEVVGVEVPAAEGVVVPRHDRVAGGDEVGPGEELAHQLRRLADLRVRGDRVVPGGDLEVEPGGEHVLAEDRARPARARRARARRRRSSRSARPASRPRARPRGSAPRGRASRGPARSPSAPPSRCRR